VKKGKPVIFVETSVFVRFLTRDIEDKYQKVHNLIAAAESGSVKLVTSNIVWFEVIYVTTKIYKYPIIDVVTIMSRLRDTRSLTMVETTNTPSALSLWQKTKRPYGDCLIATQIPERAQLATFDKDFKKLVTKEKLWQWS